MPMPKEQYIYEAYELKNQTEEELHNRVAALMCMRAFPAEVIVNYIEKGYLDINDDKFLFTLEKMVDRRIKPFNPPRPEMTVEAKLKAMKEQKEKETATVNGKQMPVAKTDQLEWMDKQLSAEERYKVAVEKKDAMISSSDWLQLANFSDMVDSPVFRNWCTPELFDYLSMSGEKGMEELRAVAYPLIVSFDHTVWKGDGKDWVCPYLTFVYNATGNNNGVDMPTENNTRTVSFYLNHNREVQIMRGKVIETFYEDEYSSKKDMMKYINARKKDYQDKHHNSLKKAYFYNIKLSEGVHALIVNDGTEGNLERKKGVPLNDCYKWNQVYDVTGCKENGIFNLRTYWNKKSPEEIKRIEEKGRESLEKLDDYMFNPKRYQYGSNREYGYLVEVYNPIELGHEFRQ